MKEELKDQEEKVEEKVGGEVEVEEKVEAEGEVEVEREENDTKSTENQDIPDSFASLEDAMKVIAHLQLKLRNANNAVEEGNHKVLRLQADFDNFRKRKAKEMSDNIRFANRDLLVNILPVLDNFDRTLDAIEKTDNLAAIKEGISMVDSSMKRQLTKIGLEPIDAKGKEFDVDLHEAISTVPVDDEEQKGKVIDEIEKGYRFKDRVIRFSKVIVGE
jgi:molecular chaperone GrpE